MPVTLSDPRLWPGECEEDNRICPSALQASSDPELQSGCDNHPRKPPLSQTTIENNWDAVHHPQGEHNLRRPQGPQYLQISEEISSATGIQAAYSWMSSLEMGENDAMPEPLSFDTTDTERSASTVYDYENYGLPYWFSGPPPRESIDPFIFSADHEDQYNHNAKTASDDHPIDCKAFASLGFPQSQDEAPREELCQSEIVEIKSPLGDPADDSTTTTSDYEDDNVYDTSNDLLNTLTDYLSKRLLFTYFTHTAERESTEGETKESNRRGVPDAVVPDTTGEQTVVDHQYSRASNPAKRKRKESSQNRKEEDEDEDEAELPAKKRARLLKEDALLACPFAKWKPLSYQSCHKYIMKDIRRVKQHLRRSHKRPLHCPTCWDTFKSEEVFYSHIEGRSCLPQPKRQIEGVSATQQEHLERKVDRKLSKSDQWYSIFSTLFPDSPLPRSAYLESDLSAELLDFQKFMASDGLDIVEQTVHEQIPSSLVPQAEEIVAFSQVLFQQAIPEILKRYETTRPHKDSPDSGYESVLPSSNHSMPDDHNIDEGGRLESTCEIIDPIQNNVSLEDFSATFVPDDLPIPMDNILNVQEMMAEMEGFLRTDISWNEGAQGDSNLSIE